MNNVQSHAKHVVRILAYKITRRTRYQRATLGDRSRYESEEDFFAIVYLLVCLSPIRLGGKRWLRLSNVVPDFRVAEVTGLDRLRAQHHDSRHRGNYNQNLKNPSRPALVFPALIRKQSSTVMPLSESRDEPRPSHQTYLGRGFVRQF